MLDPTAKRFIWNSPRHFKAANILVNFGNVYADLGRLIEVEKYYEQTLKIQEAHYDKNHVVVAITLNNVRYLCMQLKQHSLAKQHLLLAKATCIREPGNSQYLSNIAKLLQQISHKSGKVFNSSGTISQEALHLIVLNRQHQAAPKQQTDQTQALSKKEIASCMQGF